MNQVKTKLAEGGRIVIPAEYRQALGLQIGDEVILRLEDGAVRIWDAGSGEPLSESRVATSRTVNFEPHAIFLIQY